MNIRYLLLCGILLPMATLHATIRHVPTDYDGIGVAIEDAVPGDTVLVADGVYNETLLIDVPDLLLASHFILDDDSTHISSVIIQTDGEPGLVNRPVTVLDSLSGVFRMIGVTLRNGTAMGDILIWNHGGGLLATNTTIELHHNRFIDNEAGRGGGAALVGCVGELTGNVFDSNHGATNAGGLAVDVGVYEVTNNQFMNNESSFWDGGGLSSGSASGMLVGNLFLENRSRMTGGGADVFGGDSRGSWDILRNRFIANESGEGAGLFVGNLLEARVDSNEFISNYAVRDDNNNRLGAGGGLFLGPTIDSLSCSYNWFMGNYTNYLGGALAVTSSYLIHHNIFIANKGARFGCCYSSHNNDPIVEPIATYNIYIRTESFGNEYPVHYCGAVSAYGNTTFTFEENDFYYQEGIAAGLNPSYHGDLIVQNNYWGDSSGPYHANQNPNGQGDTVSTEVDILPFETEPCTDWRPPLPFDLVSPAHDTAVSADTVLFQWREAYDENSDEDLTYRLEVSLNPAFSESDTVLIVNDTSYAWPGLPLNRSLWWRVRVRDPLTLEAWSTTVNRFIIFEDFVEESGDGLPNRFAIHDLYPNPFNSSALVVVAVPTASVLRAVVHDITGRQVNVLADRRVEAGYHSFSWTPEGSSGVYLLTVAADHGWTATRRLVYVK